MTDQQYIVKLESALRDTVELLQDIANFWTVMADDQRYAERLGERTAEVLDKAAKVRG